MRLLRTMASPRSRGLFIVFEGLDRSGKSTQCSLLRDALKQKNHSVCEDIWRFPDRQTPIGKMISAYLSGATEGARVDDHALHLLFSANRWEKIASLEPILASGTHIVADRYAFSGVAYSVGAKALDWTWSLEADRGLPAPDLVIFLDIDPNLAAKRGQYGQEIYEKLSIQQAVADAFRKVADLVPSERWKRIAVEETMTMEEIHRKVLDAVDEKMDEVGLESRRYLWWDKL